MSDTSLPGFMQPTDPATLARINADRVRRGWAPLGDNGHLPVGGGSVVFNAASAPGYAAPTINPPVGASLSVPPANIAANAWNGQPVRVPDGPLGTIPQTYNPQTYNPQTYNPQTYNPQTYNPLLNITPPPPQPDTSVERTALAQINRGIADKQVLPPEQAAMENTARLEQWKAQQAAMPTHDPNDPAYHPAAYTPTALPTWNPIALPTRPAPGRDALSSGLAMLAGLFDPSGAGGYNAAPIMAGVNVANQQYEDRLRGFQQAVDEQTRQNQATAANAQLQNQAQLTNLGQQHAADVASLEDRERLAAQDAALSGEVAGAKYRQSPLADFAARARAAAQSGADAAAIEREIQQAYATWQAQMAAWEKTLSPAARLQAMNERVQAESLMNGLRQKFSESNAGAFVPPAGAPVWRYDRSGRRLN